MADQANIEADGDWPEAGEEWRRWRASGTEWPKPQPRIGFGFKPLPVKVEPERAARRAVVDHRTKFDGSPDYALLLRVLSPGDSEILGHLYGNADARFDDFADDKECVRRNIDRLNVKLRRRFDFPLIIRKSRCGRLWLDVRS